VLGLWKLKAFQLKVAFLLINFRLKVKGSTIYSGKELLGVQALALVIQG